MNFLKTFLVTTCISTLAVNAAHADGHANGAVVISDAIGIPEVGPDVITLAGLAALFAIANATSSASTTQ
jgi:hypothetical protein